MSANKETNENAAGQAIVAELETATQEAIMATSNFFALPILSSSEWTPKVGDLASNVLPNGLVLTHGRIVEEWTSAAAGEHLGWILRNEDGQVALPDENLRPAI